MRTISDAAFGPPRGGVRRLRFVPRASIPIEAACMVARGVRASLRELLGSGCELVLGEPAALAAEAWPLLAADAHVFVTRGRATDVVLVVPQADARRLVLHAFGEGDADVSPHPRAACSALELRALERIAARCAAAFEPLAAERCAGSRPVAADQIPACTAYFDLRVRAPLALTLGVGIARDLARPAPLGALPAHALDAVTVKARAVFAEGTINASDFVALRPGDVVKLETKVGAPASLNLASRRLAMGVPGVVNARTAFLVHDVASGAQ